MTSCTGTVGVGRFGCKKLIGLSLLVGCHLASCFSTPTRRYTSIINQNSLNARFLASKKSVTRGHPLLISKESHSGEQKKHHKRDAPKRAVQIYTDYAKRLWKQTGTDVRESIAQDKATAAIRSVEHIMEGEEYVHFSDESKEARQQLLTACQNMLKVMHTSDDEEKEMVSNESATTEQSEETQALVTVEEKKSPVKKKAKKNRRSILFGAVMGLAVACWVFSGNYLFTLFFTLMTILGQLEYYRMVINTGIYPARRISVVGACSMFVTALFAPELHQICLPMFGLWAMIWFLTMRRNVSTISEIATTFTGMFYLGYVPSFWVRIRLIGEHEPTRLAHIAGPILEKLGRKSSALPAFLPQAIHLPITNGAIFIFWTWLCLAFSDVGAYFVGRTYGKTKLGTVAPAAGMTSPNKSVEGVIGGCATSACLGMLGAWVQKWPAWAVTGAVHGVLLGLLGLIGDLTASMLKRNAGLKDFGDLIPEHGGIMDRVDSFIFTAPYSWLVISYVIPALKKAARARAAMPV